jgi:predicted alpha/beta hydrolase
MEWRNHGESSHSTQKFDFETIANYDLDSTLDFLFNNQNIARLDCVLHSGGGLALTMLLVKKESYRSNIDSITLFGVQAFGAGIKIGSRFKIFVGKYLSALVGEVPAKVVGSTEHSEGYYMMKQWFDWNLKRNFKGRDGFDYKSRMHEIHIPILSICAEGDSFIAPKTGCEKFLNAFENDQTRLVYLSEKNGNLENYNHSRILKSQNSKKEVWPLVAEWIENKGNIN